MISSESKKKLLRIIKENMIPEYKNCEKIKEDIKKKYLDYLENKYLTKKDKELIDKNKDIVVYSQELLIGDLYCYGRIDGESYIDRMKRITIEFDKPIPKIVDDINSLINIDKNWYNLLKPLSEKHKEQYDIFLKKCSAAMKFLNHKNSTIGQIKENFPELYKLYKGI